MTDRHSGCNIVCMNFLPAPMARPGKCSSLGDAPAAGSIKLLTQADYDAYVASILVKAKNPDGTYSPTVIRDMILAVVDDYDSIGGTVYPWTMQESLLNSLHESERPGVFSAMDKDPSPVCPLQVRVTQANCRNNVALHAVERVKDKNEQNPGEPGGTYYLALKNTPVGERVEFAKEFTKYGADAAQVRLALGELGSSSGWPLLVVLGGSAVAVGSIIGILIDRNNKKCRG